jgi:hypothetical protein
MNPEKRRPEKPRDDGGGPDALTAARFLNRRQWVSGAGALVGAPLLAAAAGPVTQQATAGSQYDYLFFDFSAGAPPYPRPASTLGSMLADALDGTQGKRLGLFVPQIGWTTSQAAVVLSWRAGDAGRVAALARLSAAAGLKAVQRHALTPTVRPVGDALPRPGGIYVHRWFVIDAGAIDEFVALSVQGWADFETRFEANIFGLWTAARTADDLRDGATRVFLLTRYKDHGVWEASRDPSTAAMKAFARRQALTRVTWNASTLLVPG